MWGRGKVNRWVPVNVTRHGRGSMGMLRIMELRPSWKWGGGPEKTPEDAGRSLERPVAGTARQGKEGNVHRQKKPRAR